MKRIVLLLLSLLLTAALVSASALDLSGRTFDKLDDLKAEIDAAQDRSAVDLTGVELTVDQRRELIAAYPDTHFVWTMTVWGVTVSSEDTEVTFEGNEVVRFKDMAGLLDCMPNLKTVNMWDKRPWLKEVDDYFTNYPDVTFGMTIAINSAHKIRTDMTAYSTLGRQPQINGKSTHYFNYLPGLKALDIGHMNVHSIDFLKDAPKLKILIVADTAIRNIDALVYQTDLEYLEIFKNYITDLSPLSGLTNLVDLNIGYNKITDLSPLYGLTNLKRLWVQGNWNLTDEEIERFKEHVPGCEVVRDSYGATGNQTDSKGKQIPGTSWRHHKHYDTIHWIFNHNEYIGWDVEVPQVKTAADK